MVLAIGSFVFLSIAYLLSEVKAELLPADQSALPWWGSANTDEANGDGSNISVRDQGDGVDFNFTLSEREEYAQASFAFLFADPNDLQGLRDLSQYDSLILELRCKPDNIFKLVFYTYDSRVTRAGDITSFRNLTGFIPCVDSARRVEIDLRRLALPEWWFLRHQVEFSDRSDRLDKVLGFAIFNSLQSPRGIDSQVSVSSVELRGRSWRGLIVVCSILAIFWAGFAAWNLRLGRVQRPEEVAAVEPQARLLGAYQPVLTPVKRDKESQAVLNYMVTKYAKPETSLTKAVADLGINRTRINTILKNELGLTFSAYLSRLRLTEAARLILEKDASVSEIGYMVGYGNSSYFITVFKKEFGCTPKNYKVQQRKKIHA